MSGARPHPRALAVAAVALLVVGLAEGVVRLGEARLPEPSEWYTRVAQTRMAEAERLAAEGIESDVLFVGTSMVLRGVLVQRIETNMPTVAQARNAALPAGQTPVIERWLGEAMVPRVRPRRVVWGVSSLDFNGNRAEPTIERYGAARAARPGWVGAVDRFLGRTIALSRNRNALRAPEGVGWLLGVGEPDPGWAIGARLGVDPDRLMAPRNTTDGNDGRTSREAARIREGVLGDWVFGEREAEAFRSAIRLLQEQGIEVAVMVMPVPGAYIDLHPRGVADYRAFLASLEAETAALGIPLLDFSSAFTDDAFVDYTHLNGASAAEFSMMVAEALTELGW